MTENAHHSDRIVISMHDYSTHDELRAFLRTALQGRMLPRSWRIGNRPRHSRGLPTDFAVVELKSKSASSRARRLLRGCCKNNHCVESVWPQRYFPARTPLAARNPHPSTTPGSSDHIQQPHDFVTRVLNASHWWSRGATGQNVRIAIFDTGLNPDHTRFLRHSAEVINFTDEDTSEDRVGHSTFMAGTLGSTRDCLGFAPDAELTFVRVFDSQQGSSTSWFLDGFNFILHHSKRFDLINLSVGGPDFRDAPFASKVRELARRGVTIVSGAGNSGPTWGSLLNPADEAWVVGVGGLRASDGHLADWSSRGPTLWEQPHGAGRMGVDVVTHGEFWSAHPSGRCQHQWGTSVACPVVVGVLALLLSALGSQQREALRSPSAIKQVLAESSQRLAGPSYLEQGAGSLQPHALYAAMERFTPHVSSLPPAIDATDCPYYEPHCEQPLYAGSQPLLLNLTILDSARADGWIVRRPAWRPHRHGGSSSTVRETSDGSSSSDGGVLSVRFAYAPQLSAWAGFVGVEVRVSSTAAGWEGVVSGDIVVDVADAPSSGGDDGGDGGGGGDGSDGGSAGVRSVVVPIRLRVIMTPPRHRRLLFDSFHSSAYPSGFFPTDDLASHAEELMDSKGDHLHSSMRSLFRELRASGFYVETLSSDFTTFDAASYGALILVDSEERYLPQEARKLQEDVRVRGLGLVVASDWFDPKLMTEFGYRDEHTKDPHACGSGGSNVPALNALLAPFGLAFRPSVYSGTYHLGTRLVEHRSGTAIARAPAGSLVLTMPLTLVKTLQAATQPARHFGSRVEYVGVIALHTLRGKAAGGGWVLALTDSSCLDDDPAPSAGSAHTSPPTRKLECRSALASLLSHLLQPVGASNGSMALLPRPPLLAQAQRLKRALLTHEGDDAERAASSDGLSEAQVRAFRASSRVSAQLRNCTTQARDCMLPLVPQPRWRPARQLRSSGAFQPAAEYIDARLQSDALWLHAVVAMLLLALLAWRLPLLSRLLRCGRCGRGKSASRSRHRALYATGQ